MAVRASLNDDVAKLFLVRESALRANGVLKCRRAVRNRWRPDDSGSNLHILLLKRLHDVLRREIARCGLIRVDPNAHRIFARAEDIDIAYAVEARELVANLEQRVIAGKERIERTVRRDQMHDHRDVGRLLFRCHADALDIGREDGNGDGHSVLY